MAFLLKSLALLSLLLVCSCAARRDDDDNDALTDIDHNLALGLGDYHDHDDMKKLVKNKFSSSPKSNDKKSKKNGDKNSKKKKKELERKGPKPNVGFGTIPNIDWEPAPGIGMPTPVAETALPEPIKVEKSPNVETDYEGVWTLETKNAGVAAMHMQLMPNNKVIMYDATSLGPSDIKLLAGMCRQVPDKPTEVDCFAHAVEYDVATTQVKPLKLETNAWCSSGGLTVEGNLISTGGFLEGGNAVRILNQNHNGVMQENAKALAGPRWYASQEKLGDGSFVVFGGRREFSMDVIARDAIGNQPRKIDLPFLKDTTDAFENNLYPFAHLLPNGDMFLLANSRSVILNPKTGQIIKELPVLPGGARNYPASGSSVLLPLNLGLPNPEKTLKPVKVEVLVCGGALPDAVTSAEKQNLLPALQDCGRITVSDPNPKWDIEMMPTRRVMHDMVILPTGEVLILNGATNGVSGWTLGEGPVLRPAVYNPEKPAGQRFKELKAATIPRMYHSAAVVLQDGRVLVAGSNTNPVYNFTAKYPTELRVETFSPHYTDPALDVYRAQIIEGEYNKLMAYGQTFTIGVQIGGTGIKKEDIKVTMLAPPFPTHGYSQNARLVVMDAIDFKDGSVTFVAPPSGNFAPPGYFILYVVHRGVPSRGVWVKIE